MLIKIGSIGINPVEIITVVSDGRYGCIINLSNGRSISHDEPPGTVIDRVNAACTAMEFKG